MFTRYGTKQRNVGNGFVDRDRDSEDHDDLTVRCTVAVLSVDPSSRRPRVGPHWTIGILVRRMVAIRVAAQPVVVVYPPLTSPWGSFGLEETILRSWAAMSPFISFQDWLEGPRGREAGGRAFSELLVYVLQYVLHH